MKCRNSKKGATASLSELVLIIFALALGLLLFSIAGKFTNKQAMGNFDGETIEGEPAYIYEVLAKLAEDCWNLNSQGTSQESDLCFSVKLVADEDLNESVFNEYLDCKVLPNNYLNVETRTDTECGGKDKVYWEILHKDVGIKITYSASRKRIEILEEDPIYLDEGCLLKCNEICDDAKLKCEEDMASCMGADCEERLEDCRSNADEMKEICAFICTS